MAYLELIGDIKILLSWVDCLLDENIGMFMRLVWIGLLIELKWFRTERYNRHSYFLYNCQPFLPLVWSHFVLGIYQNRIVYELVVCSGYALFGF